MSDPFSAIELRPDEAEARFRAEAAKRILVLDGAMGTEVQALGLDGERTFAATASPPAPAISRATTTS